MKFDELFLTTLKDVYYAERQIRSQAPCGVPALSAVVRPSSIIEMAR